MISIFGVTAVAAVLKRSLMFEHMLGVRNLLKNIRIECLVKCEKIIHHWVSPPTQSNKTIDHSVRCVSLVQLFQTVVTLSPCLSALTALSATWDQAPGAAPHSTTTSPGDISCGNRSTISSSL